MMTGKGSSLVEYVVLIVVFFAAILLMQKQLSQALFGRWQTAGDGFSHGQQYDPQKTLECQRYMIFHEGTWKWDLWYSQKCYECCMDKENTSDCTEFGFNQSLQGVTANRCRTNNPMIPWGNDSRWCCATSCETPECKD